MTIIGILLIVIGFGIGYTTSSKHYQTQLSEIRTAWYNAAIDAEEHCAETQAKYNIREPDMFTAAYFMAVGELIGTSYAIESMNKVLIALGENPLTTSDLPIIATRIENIAKRMIQEGKILNYESDAIDHHNSTQKHIDDLYSIATKMGSESENN